MMMDEEGAALNRAGMTQPRKLDETRPAAVEMVPEQSQALQRPQPTTTHQTADLLPVVVKNSRSLPQGPERAYPPMAKPSSQGMTASEREHPPPSS